MEPVPNDGNSENPDRLSQKNFLKDILRKGLNKMLHSSLLLEKPSAPELQTLHSNRMLALRSEAKMGRLRGKVAIVTGGASGIGLATALLFAREGAKVVVADSQRGAVDEISSNGGEAIYVQTDLLVDAEVEAMVQEAVSAYGKIDVLVNGAGALVYGSETGLAPQRWQGEPEVNLKSAFRCCQHAIPQMVRGGGGSVIITASTKGIIGVPETAGYAAAKDDLIALTRELADLYGGYRIRANCVLTGVVLNPIYEAKTGLDWRTATTQENNPLGFIGVPEDIAYINLFLASDESSYITGTDLIADGGITMGVS